MRPGATWGYFGVVPSKSLLVPSSTRNVPPKLGLCPKESGRLGTTGVRSSSRPDTPKILVIDLVLMSKSRFFFRRFWDENPFFLVFTPKFAHFVMKTFFSVSIPEFMEFRAYFVMKTFFCDLHSRI